jgi:16S rRNA G966 N2-methylase RsmD
VALSEAPATLLAMAPPSLPLPGPATRSRASRSDALYGVHAYHTKVPPAVAASYIAQHCPENGVVIDPFCGSGMTGLGAVMTGRRARLSDLSPAAAHIARNYCTPCDVDAFDEAVKRVLSQVETELAAMYTPANAAPGDQIQHVVWSDERSCPRCDHVLLLWDQRHEGLRVLTCPSCGHEAAKSQFSYVGEKPVQTAISTGGNRKQEVRDAQPGDVPESVEIPADRWFPTDPFDASRPMWRRAHADMGVKTVADFFSPRNLAALAALWTASTAEPDARVRSALRFSLTAIVNRASRRYQWNAKRPTNVLGGTLYISSLRYEWNVLSLWRRKVAAVRRLLSTGPAEQGRVSITRESAAGLSLPDASADYCFCDPPFGAHIVYSDVSLLWEAWLGALTPRTDEAIVVSTGDHPKTVDEYGDLLRRSFAEIHRVLKPGATATIVFQATSAAVWAAIVQAGRDAGLQLRDVDTLNKGQPSFKQIKGTQEGQRVAQTDVVLTFAKESPEEAPSTGEVDVLRVLRNEVADARLNARPVSVGHVYAVVAALLDEHFDISTHKKTNDAVR